MEVVEQVDESGPSSGSRRVLRQRGKKKTSVEDARIDSDSDNDHDSIEVDSEDDEDYVDGGP